MERMSPRLRLGGGTVHMGLGVFEAEDELDVRMIDQGFKSLDGAGPLA
jgi:hypothetical protein